MVIAGEWYLCVNLLMDLLCLAAVRQLCGSRARPLRLLLAALLGTGLSAAVLAGWGVRAGTYAALPLAVLMALTAFGIRGCPEGTASLLLAGLTTAGLAECLSRLGLRLGAALLCCLPALGALVRMVRRWRSRAGERAELRLLFEAGGVTLDGMVDTGNLLRDPVTALPVVVAPYAALRQYLPDGTSCGDWRTLPRGFRLICVQTAAGSRMMMCFRPRALYMRCGRVWHAVQAVVAISPALQGRRALLPPALKTMRE